MRQLLLLGFLLCLSGATCGPPDDTPVDPATCPPPTGEQCQSPRTKCDHYFADQAKFSFLPSGIKREESPCSLLFVQSAISEASKYPERDVLKPTTYTAIQIHPPDVEVVPAHELPPASPLTVSGLTSFSPLSERLTTIGQIQHTNPLVSLAARNTTLLRAKVYDANGDEVASCAEYVYEKFYDLSVYEDQVTLASGVDPFRDAYDLAYAPGGANAPRSAIGSRHLVNQAIRGRDGTPAPLVLPFEAGGRPKNDYFRVRKAAEGVVTFSKSTGEDGLFTFPATNHVNIALKNLNRTTLTLDGVGFNDATLEPVLAQGRAYYTSPESFEWHRQMGVQTAGVLDEKLSDFAGRREVFLELLRERDELVQQLMGLLTGEAPPSAGSPRAATRWWLDAVNPDPTAVQRVGGLGVNVLDGLNAHPFGNQTIVTQASNSPNKADAAPSRVQTLGGGQWIGACGPAGNPIICLAYRLAALDQAIEGELKDARDLGCLDLSGPGPCDWSPRDFAQRMAQLGELERHDAFVRCEETIDSFQLAKSREFRLAAPDGGVGVNYPAQDYTQNPTRVELYFSRLDEYLDVLAGTVGPLMSRKQVNGSYKLRLARYEGDSHQMGDEWFGAHLNYTAGFAMEDVGPGTECVIKTRVDGDFNAGADVLTSKVDLVSVSLHANEDHFTSVGSVFGETWDIDEPVPREQVAVFSEGDISYTEFGHAEGYITIGYIVITIGAGAGGGVGYAFEVKAGKQTVQGNPCTVSRLGVTPQVIPFAYVEAQAYAALEAVVARAGVKGYLTLVRVSIPVSGELSLGPNPNAAAVIDANFKLGAELKLNFFSGRIVVFVEAGICPLCVSAEAELVSWPGLTYRIPLFEYELEVVLGDLRRVATQQGVIPSGAPSP